MKDPRPGKRTADTTSCRCCWKLPWLGSTNWCNGIHLKDIAGRLSGQPRTHLFWMQMHLNLDHEPCVWMQPTQRLQFTQKGMAGYCAWSGQQCKSFGASMPWGAAVRKLKPGSCKLASRSAMHECHRGCMAWKAGVGYALMQILGSTTRATLIFQR